MNTQEIMNESNTNSGPYWEKASGSLRILVGLALLAAGAPFVSADDNRAPKVPDEIVVPEGNRVHFHGYAEGFQIYTWNGSSWGAAVPDATLFDNEGNVVAIHFGTPNGPAWKSNSGSEVVGVLPPKAAIVDSNSIPWLRLNADPIRTHGPGIFANTTFIHRVNTDGGKAPLENGAFLGQVAKVPYTADYFFYRKSNH